MRSFRTFLAACLLAVAFVGCGGRPDPADDPGFRGENPDLSTPENVPSIPEDPGAAPPP